MAERRAGGRGGRGGRTAYVDEVYERDDAARDARAEERFQRLKLRVASVIQRLEALEVGRLPRRQPFKPSLPTEVDFSDGVSITKPLPGNHQSTGRTRAVKIPNRDSRLWESGLKINFPEFQKGMTSEKILEVGAVGKKVIEEILVEGDVGDSIDDVLEEELDKIFLDTNTSLLQLQVDWDLPATYDDYPEEYDYVVSTKEDHDFNEGGKIEVAVRKNIGIDMGSGTKQEELVMDEQPIGVVGMKSVDGINCEINGNVIKTMSTYLDASPTMNNIFSTPKPFDWDRVKHTVIGSLDMNFLRNIQKSEGVEAGHSNQFVDPFWEYIEVIVKENIWIAEQVVTNNIAFIFTDSSLQFGVRKINLRYKIDADKLRRIQLYKLEDEFLQDGENDAV